MHPDLRCNKDFLVGLLFLACAQGTAFDAGAQARRPGVAQEPVRDSEPRERDYPERNYPERDTVPFKPPSRDPGARPPKSRPPKVEALSISPPQSPSRDPALARCDGFRSELESVIRQEMKGGSPAAMEKLGAKRQSIYQARMDAGC